jgi:hypothetical protein
MNEDPLAQALATTTFDPEDFAITGTWLSPPFRPTADGAPAMITVGLNSDDLSYAYVALDPPGRRLVAGVWPGFRSYWAQKAVGAAPPSTNEAQNRVFGADMHRYQHCAWSVLTR